MILSPNYWSHLFKKRKKKKSAKSFICVKFLPEEERGGTNPTDPRPKPWENVGSVCSSDVLHESQAQSLISLANWKSPICHKRFDFYWTKKAKKCKSTPIIHYFKNKAYKHGWNCTEPNRAAQSHRETHKPALNIRQSWCIDWKTPAL